MSSDREELWKKLRLGCFRGRDQERNRYRQRGERSLGMRRKGKGTYSSFAPNMFRLLPIQVLYTSTLHAKIILLGRCVDDPRATFFAKVAV